MARTIDEIKESITTDFMNNEDAAKAYGFTRGDNFAGRFGKVSVESILFYIAACAIWVVETLFDSHKKDIDARIDAILPHRPKWYRDKALAFMKDKTLIPESDEYDTTGMSEAEIAEARVVKHAVAIENKNTSVLTIKVAGEQGEKLARLESDTLDRLKAYFAEIKDAGIRIDVVSKSGDDFTCSVDVYYDPMMTDSPVRAKCEESIRNYVENLPFNGEYTNMALIDALQQVEGVKIAELRNAWDSGVPIDARCVPESGYFVTGELSITMKPYHEQV